VVQRLFLVGYNLVQDHRVFFLKPPLFEDPKAFCRSGGKSPSIKARNAKS
jgi:hypothetical protein